MPNKVDASEEVSGESSRGGTIDAVVTDVLGDNEVGEIADVPAPKVTSNQPGEDSDDAIITTAPVGPKVAELSTIAPFSEPDITGGNLDDRLGMYRSQRLNSVDAGRMWMCWILFRFQCID